MVVLRISLVPSSYSAQHHILRLYIQVINSDNTDYLWRIGYFEAVRH